MSGAKPYRIIIVWGLLLEADSQPVEYKFETKIELDAFMKGVRAADGYIRHKPFESKRDAWDFIKPTY
ncbi:MAG: hypothetical protein ACPGVT_11000 [Maricaulaceae bacterium]